LLGFNNLFLQAATTVMCVCNLRQTMTNERWTLKALLNLGLGTAIWPVLVIPPMWAHACVLVLKTAVPIKKATATRMKLKPRRCAPNTGLNTTSRLATHTVNA